MTTPNYLVYPLGQGQVLAGPRAARLLLRGVQLLEWEARRNGWVPPDLLELRAAFEVAAEYVRNMAEHAELPQSPSLSSSVLPSSPSTAVGTSLIGTREAAELLACTDRNVRALCSRGVFSSAMRRRGSWWVLRDEVEALARR